MFHCFWKIFLSNKKKITQFLIKIIIVYCCVVTAGLLPKQTIKTKCGVRHSEANLQTWKVNAEIIKITN